MVYEFGREKKDDSVKIGYVMTGSIDEGGWNGMNYKGISAVCEEYDVELINTGTTVANHLKKILTKENMIKSSEHLGKIKTKYGVFFVMGNHDKGYRSSLKRGWSEYDVISELKKNGVNILRDETILIDNSFYLIGRKDASERVERLRKRKSMDELTTSLDKSKYMIVLDHQPADYQNQAQSGVDLVLSGHTHGGQLFPFNKIGKLIGANDFIYGTTKINKTNFIIRGDENGRRSI